MFRPLELFVGLRYTRAKRRNHFISFISLTSMLGIALGVAALITVLSVMNGFERELRSRILGMASHATIQGDRQGISDWSSLAEIADGHPRIVGSAPYVEGFGMLMRGGGVQGVLIRGVEPDREPSVSEIDEFMLVGELKALKAGEYEILLGINLARTLGADVGAKVTMVAPQAKVTPAGVIPRVRRFTVAGIFRVDHGEYDGRVAIIHIADAARLFRLGENVSGLRLKVDEVFDAPYIAREIAPELGDNVFVRDWTQMNANFFRALKLEKTVMFVILALIVAVAAFNIVSTLIMVVTDKEPDIAILRTLGATPGSIMLIFIVQGILIGFIGTVLGAIGGIALAQNVESVVPFIESIIGRKFLPPDIYYISDLPSDMRWPDVITIVCVAFVMTVIATLYPAWRAARTQPAEALRYE